MLEVTIYHCSRICFLILLSVVKLYFQAKKKKMTMMGLPQPRHGTQTIEFGNLSEENSCVRVMFDDVKIISSQGDHLKGSSKVKMNNVVDYSWEEKFYTGQLLAVHMAGTYIAYGIKAGNRAQSSIRVVNRESSKRALIKGIEGAIEDLAFAYIPNQVILASLDVNGTVLVHDIKETSGMEISCKQLLHILGDDTVEHLLPRVFWCPYMPEEELDPARDPYEEEILHLLAITRDNKIEMWNVAVVSRSHPPDKGPVRAGQVHEGFLEIEVSTHLISDAAFSPDGTAIATASYDGKCKFYQVYMHGEGEPRCLHEWEPHGGEPVTTLLFLDNLKNPHPDFQFWKFAMTGAKSNCELKLWSCETWDCLQTISFTPKIPRGNSRLKAAIDLSAGYILLSDMKSRLLYVLELQKLKTETLPFVQTITEFKLPCPILSFGIVEAGKNIFKANTSFNLEDLCNGEGDDESHEAVVVRMYLVQPKSLQECHIVFQTSNAYVIPTPPPLNCITSSNKTEAESSSISHQIVSLPEATAEKSNTSIVSSAGSQPVQLNLMTPDAFHSPANRDSPNNSRETITTVERVPEPPTMKTFTANPGLISANEVAPAGGGFVSAGSSPSREVQEILSSPRLYYQNESTQQASGHSPSMFKTVNAPTEKANDWEMAFQSLRSDLSVLVTHLASKQSNEIKQLKEELAQRDAETLIKVEEIVKKTVANVKVKCCMSHEHLADQVVKGMESVIVDSINKEMQQNVRPAVTKTMDELKEITQTELSQKLSMSDQVIKDNLTKVIRSKQLMETLGSQLSITAGGAMEHIYKESFTKMAVPLFERACGNLFKQINETFSKGLSEYITEIEGHACKSNERTNMEIMAIQSATEHMTAAAQKFSTVIEKESKRLEDVVVDVGRSLRGTVLNNGSIRSGTATPAQHLDSQFLQTQLSQLIKQGDYNAAFQQALSAADLNLVTYVCEKVGPNLVFSTSNGCILQQHILLSLIQQLSADMSQHSEIKYKYLEEAIMNLDNCNPNTREHAPAVLGALSKQLQLYMSTNPKGKFARRAKMLAMATDSLLRY